MQQALGDAEATLRRQTVMQTLWDSIGQETTQAVSEGRKPLEHRKDETEENTPD